MATRARWQTPGRWDWNKFLHDAFGGLQRDVLILTLGVRELLKLLGIAQGEAKGIGGSLGGLLAPKKAATGYEVGMRHSF